jgi:hypothetical protein
MSNMGMSDYQREILKTSGNTVICDSCLWEAQGFGRSVLENDGWKWHVIPGTAPKQYFVMCDDCEKRYEERRAMLADLNDIDFETTTEEPTWLQ